MDTSDESLVRIADALERIAVSVEYLEHIAAASQPSPRLKVSRESGYRGTTPAVNLTGDRRLMVTVLNAGNETTQISRPRVQFGAETKRGGVVGRDSQAHETGDIAPGSTAVLLFEFDQAATSLLHVSPLLLRIPHMPGRVPLATVLEVQLMPLGLKEGRHGWNVASSREVLDRAAA